MLNNQLSGDKNLCFVVITLSISFISNLPPISRYQGDVIASAVGKMRAAALHYISFPPLDTVYVK